MMDLSNHFVLKQLRGGRQIKIRAPRPDDRRGLLSSNIL
jgi:hypothetical protein